MSFEIREKPDMVEHALLVALGMPGDSRRERQALLAELQDLVSNLGIGIVGTMLEFTREVQAKYLCGIGKAMEIQAKAQELGADCVIFDNLLTPSQQREWEKLLNVTVIDREEVILDIFAQRARTREAVMQVDLARMQYALPRMSGMWKHLDRQRGGSGGGKGGGAAARGEGEKQIEVDRRLAHERIEAIRAELEVVRRQRSTQRKERKRQGIPTAAIVGYTNAGKSSLLNLMSGADVLAKNILFATLETTSRKIELPDGQPLVLTDTVGFIRNLPHRLVEAFKSTLEEATLADFLIQVVDASDREALRHYETTCEVLASLGAADKPMVVVWNKTDLIPEEQREATLAALSAKTDVPCLSMSVLRDEGREQLLSACTEMLSHRVSTARYRIPMAESRIIAIMHRDGKVISTEYEGNDALVEAILPREFAARLEAYRC
ncbi:MAG TPA: GTPase HflX [Candidatus Akkermansia intestinigallinarum]|mgnify:CR=1 FL=1|uniref:GTPase HflX n=1 Tax=Candidatus Akkermansia intestinigallinarum TaxID=2838431 RepID=A0A9D1VB51_9BACT|nr:GTPase HflX [Candidatus Akkermansia intestinigallinarum]